VKGEGWHKYDHVVYVLGSSQAVLSENIKIGLKAGMHQKQAVAKAFTAKRTYIRSVRRRKEDWEQDGLGTLWDRTVRNTHNITLQKDWVEGVVRSQGYELVPITKPEGETQ